MCAQLMSVCTTEVKRSVKRSQFVYSDDVTHPEGGVCCTGKDSVKMEIHNYESGFQVYNTE